MPARGRSVVGLRSAVLDMVASGWVGAIAVAIRALLGMNGAGRGYRTLVRRLRYRLRPGLPPLDSQLTRCLNGRLV